jgi:hypothetical protein
MAREDSLPWLFFWFAVLKMFVCIAVPFRLNHVIECYDELLTEEDKRRLIHPETDIKDNRATYHSYSEMPPEFSHSGTILLGEGTKKALCCLVSSFVSFKEVFVIPIK